MEARIYECESKDQGKLKTLLSKDPYADISFSKQGYKLKEWKVVGGEADKYYLYIKAEPDFFKWAEEKFKELPSIKRTAKELEQKIIANIEAEDNAAEVGMGAIFG